MFPHACFCNAVRLFIRLYKVWGGYFLYKEFLYRKIKRVLFPYVFWALFIILLQGRSLMSFFQGVSHLWFLLFIFEAYVSFRMLERWFVENTYMWFVIGSVFTLLSASKLGGLVPYHILGIDKYLMYMPYYVMGAYTNRYLSQNNQLKHHATYILLMSGAFFIISFSLNSRYVFIILPSLILSTSIMTFAISRNIEKVPEWISNLDKCSMGIYILHHIIIQQVNSSSFIHPYMVQIPYVYPFLLFGMVFPLSWGLTYMSRTTKIGRTLLG